MTNPLVRIAELEAQIAELKKQLQKNKAPEQLYGRLGSFPTVHDGDRIGISVDNRPDSDGDVRLFYLDQSGEAQYLYKRVDDVEWLTGKVLTSSEEIAELPTGTVVCFTNSPNEVAVRVYEDMYFWRSSDGRILDDNALTEGVEVIRYGTGIGN